MKRYFSALLISAILIGLLPAEVVNIIGETVSRQITGPTLSQTEVQEEQAAEIQNHHKTLR